jgi:hypothetical protein
MDFIGPLLPDNGCDTIITFTDCLNSDIRLITSHSDLTAEELAVIFFDEWYCENGLPLNIVSDRDKLFTSKFWAAPHNLTGMKLKMSTAYHPQMDGVSERTHKTINQCICYHVDQTQHGWKHALPRIHFNLMNTINSSKGFSPLQLRMGWSPRLIPPLITNEIDDVEDICALDVIQRLEADINEAKDNLTATKILQSIQANNYRADNFSIKAGDHVLLSTLHRHNEYKKKGEKRVAKFMPHFNRPYNVTNTIYTHSTVTLDLPNKPHIFPTFHMSQITPFIENDNTLFPSRELSKPPPVMIDEAEEFFIDRILDECKCGRGTQYLICWTGYSAEDNRWLPTSSLKDCEALDIWLAWQKNST